MVDVSRISQVLPTLKCSKCSAAIRMDAVATHVCEQLPSLPRMPMPSILEASPGPAAQAQTQVRQQQQQQQAHGEADAVLGRLNTRVRPRAPEGPITRRPVMPLRTFQGQPQQQAQAQSDYHYNAQHNDDTRSIASRESTRSQASYQSGGSHNGARFARPGATPPLDEAAIKGDLDSGPYGIAGVASRLPSTVFTAPECAPSSNKKLSSRRRQQQQAQQDPWDDEQIPTTAGTSRLQYRPPAQYRVEQGQLQEAARSRPSTAGSGASGSMYGNGSFDERPGTARPMQTGYTQQPGQQQHPSHLQQQPQPSHLQQQPQPSHLQQQPQPSHLQQQPQPSHLQQQQSYYQPQYPQQQQHYYQPQTQQQQQQGRPHAKTQDPYARYGPNSVPPPGRLQLAYTTPGGRQAATAGIPSSSSTPSLATATAQTNATGPPSVMARHIRQPTSSSVGTVRTSESAASVRSSMSSAALEPLMPFAAKQIPLDERTPRAAPNTTASTLQMRPGTLPRSGTTHSFDMLLADIGASIDELQPPMVPAANDMGSPSSSYSPVQPPTSALAQRTPRGVPAARVAAWHLTSRDESSTDKMMTKPPLTRLGSPASLHSKETVASHATSESSLNFSNRVVAVTSAVTASHTLQSSKPTAAPACRACHQAILPGQKSMSSKDGTLTGKYHKTCFRCTVCRTPFPAGEFYVLQDRPYCAHHYHAACGSLCGVCGEGVEGACIAEGDRRWHSACYARRQPGLSPVQLSPMALRENQAVLAAGVAVHAGRQGRHGSYGRF